MTPCNILPVVPNERLLGVGWLARGMDFETGPVDRAVYDRLCELSHDPWQPFAACGVHGCEVCQFEPEQHTSANLFIPDGDRLFAAPAMITHYINAHHYKPPDAFCAAVMACPDMRSQAYRRALVACHATKLLDTSHWPRI